MNTNYVLKWKKNTIRLLSRVFWESNEIQFTSVAQSCLTFCDPMNRSTPGLPVHHQLLEFTQTHVHGARDVIQPSHPLSSTSLQTYNKMKLFSIKKEGWGALQHREILTLLLNKLIMKGKILYDFTYIRNLDGQIQRQKVEGCFPEVRASRREWGV